MFLTLFIVSLVSATLWPLASEAFFVSFLHQNSDSLLPIITVATIGNTVGSILMFELAYQFSPWLRAKLIKREQELLRWEMRLSEYGSPLLVFAWLPVVGDLLPLAGGFLKMNRIFSYFWLLLGKSGRYWVLSAATLSAKPYF